MSLARSLRVLLVVVAVLVVVLVVMWRAQRQLTYFPSGTPPPVEETLPGGTEVVLTTGDDLELRAWWVEEGPTAVMVLPGNAGNRAGRVPLATALRQVNLSVLLVDYRGFGGNPGTPSQAGLLADARAAADWMATDQGIDDVVYLGESLGGAVAVGLARDRAPAAVVLRSPFTSLHDVARAHYGPVPHWLVRDPFPAEEWISSVSAPLLVVASESDEVVPFTSSQRLFQLASQPKVFVTVPGVGHNDRELLDGDVFVDAIASFLDEHGLLPRR